MLTIRLVVVDGRLIGKSFSDQWNLETLGVQSLTYHKNGAGLKHIRAKYGVDFTFTVDTKGEVQAMTETEHYAMSGYNAIAA